ncbi:cell division cycle protein 20 homolog [Eupeodes corollae]|uniref:cell division cycle protein 20 homolog n=1 Tax=Eupeodes corollae TaxID=290404 RepID=UPI002490E944|nr:cell division cycle protein 20 homolog [Eupeodes corollae]
MAQFNYLNEINSVLSMDGELTRGPAPRWQKKMECSSSNLSTSMNTSRSVLTKSYNASFSMAPTMKTPGKSSAAADGKGKKTPSKTPNKGSKTPSGGGDRFIPNRSTTNFGLGHYLIKQEQEKTSDEENEKNNKMTPSKSDHKKLISESMQVGDTNGTRILSYQNKAPPAPESHQNPNKVVYSIKTPISTKSGSRYIPSTSDRILDAPDIINDYYLNLLDWSVDNVVCVALGNAVYLWNASTGSIEQLVEFEEGDSACSLAWIQEGHILAIGISSGAVELWDCAKSKRLRVMDGQTARVGSLAWNSFLVSSGSRDGSIIHHDVRQRDHKVTTLLGHTQEVCGLKWSTDFKYLASGGNDNLVNVWPAASASSSTGTEPIHVLNQHQAAVRALAWCPWLPNVLATGGGTADRCIKFWNVNNGSLINSVDSKSQVCALLWSKTYKELISAHGFAKNQLSIWKYPSMQKQAELTGHTSRVLQLAMSPDGSTVISAGADETLRLWNCFAADPHQAKKSTGLASKAKQSVFRQSIR